MTGTQATLAAADVWTPEDVSIGFGLGAFAVGFVVVAVGVLVLVVARLRREQARDDLLAVAEYGLTIDGAQRAAAAAPGGMPDWARRDVNTSPGVVDPQPTYVPADPLSVVQAAFVDEFERAGLPALPPLVHAVGQAPIPPGPRETWEHLDDIAAGLAGLSPTQMLPTVGGPDQPVRLR